MRKRMMMRGAASLLLAAALTIAAMPPAAAASAAEISRDARAALDRLYAQEPVARELGKRAKGILVFPSVLKAGLVVGGQYGEGALFRHGKVAGYYNTAGGSYGLQAGAQSYAYALFFMTEGALSYLGKSEGLEIGVGPSVVVVDQGMAKSLTSTTATQEVYAFIWGQKGLMAGVGIQGNKITKLDKK